VNDTQPTSGSSSEALLHAASGHIAQSLATFEAAIEDFEKLHRTTGRDTAAALSILRTE